MKLQYYSNVKDGQLQNNVRQLIAKELKHFEGKRVEITIQKLKSTRSIQQNRLYWLYVTMIANELGYDKEEMHEIIKYKFLLTEKVHEATGEVMPHIKSTAKLSISEFMDLINGLIQWASQSFSIVLPEPNQQAEMDL